MPECGERCDGGELALWQIEAGALVDIAEGKFDDVTGQIRRDGLEALDDPAAGFAVDFFELGQTFGVTS